MQKWTRTSSAPFARTAAPYDGTITLAQARDELNASRKYAQAYLDAERVTLRRGDERVLRRRGRG